MHFSLQTEFLTCCETYCRGTRLIFHQGVQLTSGGQTTESKRLFRDALFFGTAFMTVLCILGIALAPNLVEALTLLNEEGQKSEFGGTR